MRSPVRAGPGSPALQPNHSLDEVSGAVSEGPNVVRWARAIRQLVGEPLVAVKLPSKHAAQADALVGQHVAAVDTHGKHLLVHLSDGHTLHCHGLMQGYWHVGRPGMLPDGEAAVRVRLRTAEWEALFLHGPVAQLLSGAELAQHAKLQALGPDVMSERFDRAEAGRRVRAAGAEIAEAIVDQNVVAGIGNTYKSEALFVAGIDPRRSAADIAPEELAALWDVVIPLMWDEANCEGEWSTLPAELRGRGERHWVYRRSGRPCLKCGSRIRLVRQGKFNRATYLCTQCQR